MHTPRARVARRAVHGVLLLDKPLGWTSNAALQRAKRLYQAEKAGHTGTLDPLATGLLPLCFGAATKFSQVSLDADKCYRATLCLGVTTTTGDAEGDVLERRDAAVTLAQLQDACERLTGAIEQVPPMHSALKHEGRALYDYARAGVVVERAARTVTIHRIDIRQAQPASCELDVHCSKGTYIRVLAEDLGRALGCGAHLTGLRRLSSGALRLEAAHTIEALEAMTPAQRDAALLSADALVSHWPAVRLEARDAGPFLSGLRRRLPLPDAAHVRVYGPEPQAFLGAGHICAGELISTRLLSPVEVQGLLTVHEPAPQRATP